MPLSSSYQPPVCGALAPAQFPHRRSVARIVRYLFGETWLGIILGLGIPAFLRRMSGDFLAGTVVLCVILYGYNPVGGQSAGSGLLFGRCRAIGRFWPLLLHFAT